MPRTTTKLSARRRAGVLVSVLAVGLGTVAVVAGPAQAVAAPSVSTLSPTSGPDTGGTKVTVLGHNFTHVRAVTFGTVAGRSVDVVSSKKLRVTAPKHAAGTVYVRVHAGAGTSAKRSPAKFRYVAAKGAIAGRVTGPAGGAQLAGVEVDVYKANDGIAAVVHTKHDGSYAATGLPAGAAYRVCANPGAITKGSPTGYRTQCYRHAYWDGYPTPPPAGAKSVPVTAGRTTRGVDLALGAGAAITGTVTAADGGAALRGVLVKAFAGDRLVRQAVTGHLGGYSLPGLAPSASGYAVCFDGSSATGGPSVGGYRPECYDSQPWDGFTSDLPEGSTEVTLSAGATASADAALDAGATISGKVTALDGGAPLGAIVYVLSSGGQEVAIVHTAADGTYSAPVPPYTPGYFVCVSGQYATGGPSQSGYNGQCYAGKAWNGQTSQVPSGSTPVPAPAGAHAQSIDFALPSGSAIQGTVTDSHGTPLHNVFVFLYDGAGGTGDIVGTVLTAADGTYAVRGLAANATYYVCFDGSRTVDPPVGAYRSECFVNKPWNNSSAGVPADAAPVTTVSGAASVANAKLARGGAISGTITADDGGAPLAGVEIDLYAATTTGDEFRAVYGTDSSGRYEIDELPAGTYKLCFYAGHITGAPPGTTYVSECYKNQAYPESAGLVHAAHVHVTAGAATAGKDAGLATAP